MQNDDRRMFSCKSAGEFRLEPASWLLQGRRMAAMKQRDLQLRTKQFALDVINFCEHLPKDETSRILSRQLLRSGTSVGANYRAAHRAKSKPDFISKMGTVLEEADECTYWIELLCDAAKVDSSVAAPLYREADELVAIAISSITTARRNLESND
jgi:four helix bundle protein